MSRILNYNPDLAASVANSVAEFIKVDLGYEDMREVIPGLLYAVALLSLETEDPQQALDEAVDILSENPEPVEISEEEAELDMEGVVDHAR